MSQLNKQNDNSIMNDWWDLGITDEEIDKLFERGRAALAATTVPETIPQNVEPYRSKDEEYDTWCEAFTASSETPKHSIEKQNNIVNKSEESTDVQDKDAINRIIVISDIIAKNKDEKEERCDDNDNAMSDEEEMGSQNLINNSQATGEKRNDDVTTSAAAAIAAFTDCDPVIPASFSERWKEMNDGKKVDTIDVMSENKIEEMEKINDDIMEIDENIEEQEEEENKVDDCDPVIQTSFSEWWKETNDGKKVDTIDVMSENKIEEMKEINDDIMEIDENVEEEEEEEEEEEMKVVDCFKEELIIICSKLNLKDFEKKKKDDINLMTNKQHQEKELIIICPKLKLENFTKKKDDTVDSATKENVVINQTTMQNIVKNIEEEKEEEKIQEENEEEEEEEILFEDSAVFFIRGVIDSVMARMLEGAGDLAQFLNRRTIQPRDIRWSYVNDEQLFQLKLNFNKRW